MTSPYAHRIEIYTDALVIAGWYDQLIYRRVSDALNGEQRRYLPLRDVTVTPLDRPTTSQRVPRLLVDRYQISVVATVEEAQPPPNYARDDLIRGTTPRSMMFFTSSFVVRAVMHMRPDLDAIEALERDDYEQFVRVSKVQIFPIRGGAPISRDFATLRRDGIVALYGMPEPVLVTPVPTLPVEVPQPEPAAKTADDGPPSPADLPPAAT